jgi:hypothetical protein
VSNEPAATPQPEEAPAPERRSGRGLSQRWFFLISGVLLFDLVALILFPPFPKGGNPGGLLYQRNARVPGAARRLGAGR